MFNYLIVFICRENYVFTCRCIKCEQQINDADITSDDDDDDDDDADAEMECDST